MQDLLLAQKRDRPAYCFQHLDLEYDPSTTAAGQTLLRPPASSLARCGSAFWAGVEFT
jgi:hypothetical protein